MIVVLAVGTGVVLSLGSGWCLLRRHVPRLSNKDLARLGIPPEIKVVKKVPPQFREELKVAFLPGPDFRWITVGGDLNQLAELDEAGSMAAERHRQITFYMMECVLRMADNYGHVLVASDNDGGFLGSVCLIPPYYKRLYFPHFMASVVPLGRPVPQILGAATSARFDAFVNKTEEVHATVMRDTPHWYVINAGVRESSQGTGVGRRLMRAAVTMAKGLPVYLECHDDNVRFYQKQGFELREHFELQPALPADGSTGDPAPFTFNAMVHPGTIEC